jgi:hypothetical protein
VPAFGIVVTAFVIFGVLLLSCSFVSAGCERFLHNLLKLLSVLGRAFA